MAKQLFPLIEKSFFTQQDRIASLRMYMKNIRASDCS